jgi:hypothetical protein
MGHNLAPSNLRSYRGSGRKPAADGDDASADTAAAAAAAPAKKLSVREKRKRLLLAKMRFAKRIADDILALDSEDAKLHYLAQVSELHALAELEHPVVTARTATARGVKPTDEQERRMTVMERFEYFLWMKRHPDKARGAAGAAGGAGAPATPPRTGPSPKLNASPPPKQNLPPILDSWFEVSEDSVAEDYLAQLKAEAAERDAPAHAQLKDQRKAEEKKQLEELKRDPTQLKQKLDKLLGGLYGMTEEEQLKITKGYFSSCVSHFKSHEQV